MKKDKTMQIVRRQNTTPSGDIMKIQDNTKRGDGEPVEKVMTTFQMDRDLKEQLKDFCKLRGLKQGEFINAAIRQALEE